MHACRFVVCLAFVFGDVRSVCVNVDSYRRYWYGTLDNDGLAESRQEACMVFR